MRGVFPVVLSILAVVPCAIAQTPTAPFAVVSAAGYGPQIAPSSLASIFGPSLATGTASAQLNSTGQLPTLLAGTMVLVNGEAAPLIYVSQSQINFVVPDDAPLGTDSVVVQVGSSGAKQTGSALVQNTAPAIFSLNASGAGPGAILNAVTFAPAPFLAVTPQNPGTDQRTRLSVFCTGVRWAGNPTHDPAITNVAANLTAQGTDSSGNSYTLEYAGAAPGFFGLDQVNLILPPQTDGAGVISLTIGAEGSTSNTVTFLMGSIPSSEMGISSLALGQSAVSGGGTVTATVSLNVPARLAGFTVSLRSDNAAAQAPAMITVPAGQVSAIATITTSSVFSIQIANISASGNSTSVSAPLEIDPANLPQVAGLAVTPGQLAGGDAASATVSLNVTAPLGGVVVQLSSNNSAAQVPINITIPFGQASTQFPITTTSVTSVQTATITAAYRSSSQTAQLTINPPLTIVLGASTVVGGNPVSATLTLGDPATSGGASVTLKSSSGAAQIPVTLTIPSGQSSGNFTINTTAVQSVTPVTIAATYKGVTETAALSVTPAVSATLSSLTISPTSVQGGQSATGTITLLAPAPIGSVIVNLQSSAFFAAQAPAFVTIPAGQSSTSFTIATSNVAATTAVTITATSGGVSKTATLTVQ